MDHQHRACRLAFQAHGHTQGSCNYFFELTHTVGPSRQQICSICLSAMKTTDRTLTHSDGSCDNAAHEVCFARWLNENAKCPFCREDLDPTDQRLPPRLPAVDNEPRILYSNLERAATVNRFIDELDIRRVDLGQIEVGLQQQLNLLHAEKRRLITERRELWETTFWASAGGNIPFTVNSRVGHHLAVLQRLIQNLDTEIDNLNRATLAVNDAEIDVDRSRYYLRLYLTEQ